MAKAAKKSPAKKSARGASSAASRKVNKSEAIREYRKANPNAGPTAITKALAAKGIKVSPPQVSNVLSAANKKQGLAPGRPGRKPAGGDQVSINSLMEAQDFAAKVGGVGAAKQLLAAVERLSK